MIKCANCGAALTRRLFRFGYSGRMFYGNTKRMIRVYSCGVCGLISLDADAGASDTEDVHDFWWEQSWLDTYSRYRDRIISSFNSRLQYIERSVSGRRILDIGCGCGFFLYAAKQRGWKTAGIDISTPAIEYANNKLGLTVVRAGTPEAHFADGEFDAVTMWDVIEHIPNPGDILDEARRVLKPDGILLIETPNVRSLIHALAGLSYRMTLGLVTSVISRIYIPSHVLYFSGTSLADMLRRHGFSASVVRHSMPSVFSDLDILFDANRTRESWARSAAFKHMVKGFMAASEASGRPYRIICAGRKTNE